MPSGLTVRTPTLEIGYTAYGDPAGFPIVLLHGFPDDIHAWDTVAPPLAAAGYRVLVPYLRGYGTTRFLDAATPRMAQQAAIAQDLIDFMAALGLQRVGLAGYDWGGRAACITAQRLGAQQCLTDARPAVAVWGGGATRRRRGGRKGALEFLSVTTVRLMASTKEMSTVISGPIVSRS